MHVRKTKRFNRFIACILLSLFCICAVNVGGNSTASAESVYPFDNTDVMADLESSGTFNINDYFWDYYGIYKSPSIMNFVEWCYSPFNPEDFALYIYFYNPQALDIDEDNPSNRIQIASAYDTYPLTKDSVPTNYDTYPLIFCSMSTRENYEGMFYKFRVVDQKGSDGLYIQDRVYSGERRYDVSGVVLANENGDIKEYGVGGTYYFTGYAAGYGPDSNASNTLKNTGFQALETISIEVHPTVYRQAGFSDLGAGHQWDINSVYFSVPERYFTEYGDLQKIKAEWWEYETQPVFVTDNEEAANAFKQYLGVNIGNQQSGLNYRFTNYIITSSGAGVQNAWKGYTYNVEEKANDFNVKRLNTLYYSFYSDLSKDVIVTGEQLKQHMKDYSASAVKGYLPVLIDGQKISADLFTDVLSNGRADISHVEDNIHHKVFEFDANDKFNMLAYDVNESGFERFLRKLFGGVAIDSEMDISPIEADIKRYINLSDSNLSNTLLINESDATTFKSFYNSAISKNERTILFRFAKTDYYSEKVDVFKDDELFGLPTWYEDFGDGVVATESVFLDFKIIHLTFQADGVYTVIPVTQNPINIINDLTPTPEPEAPDWWKAFVEWLNDLFQTIGAWGVAIAGVVVGLIIFWIIVKIFKAVCGIGNVVIKVILCLAVIAGTVVLYSYYINWVIGIVMSLGGLW